MMDAFGKLRLPLELIYMIFIELMLSDQPRVLHLKRYTNTRTGRDSITFHGNLDIVQPPITQLSREWREWAERYYVLVFKAVDKNSCGDGGLWIRRDLDLIYIDTAFCARSVRALRLSCSNLKHITQLAVDANLLNDSAGRGAYVSLMDEILTHFWNVKNLVFMAPTRANPRGNYYRGLRLVDEEEDDAQKQLAFTRFYRCGTIVTNTSQNAVMIARAPNAPSGSPIRVLMSPTDKLRANLVTGSPLHVILFQREGMRPPQINTVVGPKTLDNRALSTIAFRMHPVPVSTSEVMELVEASSTRFRPSGGPARTGTMYPSNIQWTIW